MSGVHYNSVSVYSIVNSPPNVWFLTHYHVFDLLYPFCPSLSTLVTTILLRLMKFSY